MKEKPTFDFLKKHIPNSIKLADALLIGGFAGSVMELLGKMLFLPNKNANSTDCIYLFIKKYLSKQNNKYEEYRKIFVHLFRHGGAHSVMPKGGVNITSDPPSENLHLTIKPDYKSLPLDYFWFTIFLPTFKKDLTNAVLAFASDAENNQTLQNHYLMVIESSIKEGNSFLRKMIYKRIYNPDSDYLSLQSDVKA